MKESDIGESGQLEGKWHKRRSYPAPLHQEEDQDNFITPQKTQAGGEHHEEAPNHSDISNKRDPDIWKDPPAFHYIINGDFQQETKTLDAPDRKKEMRRITKRAVSYEYRDNVMFRKASGAYKERLALAPDERADCIRELHQNHGHLGVNKITLILSARFYFRGMREAVREELRKCDSCARRKLESGYRSGITPSSLAPQP